MRIKYGNSVNTLWKGTLLTSSPALGTRSTRKLCCSLTVGSQTLLLVFTDQRNPTGNRNHCNTDDLGAYISELEEGHFGQTTLPSWTSVSASVKWDSNGACPTSYDKDETELRIWNLGLQWGLIHSDHYYDLIPPRSDISEPGISRSGANKVLLPHLLHPSVTAMPGIGWGWVRGGRGAKASWLQGFILKRSGEEIRAPSFSSVLGFCCFLFLWLLNDDIRPEHVTDYKWVSFLPCDYRCFLPCDYKCYVI